MSIILQIIAPLITGVIIYALYREIPIIDPLHKVFPILNNSSNNWLIYSLPDGLWLYSMNSCFLKIWKQIKRKELIMWIFTSLSASIGAEFMQLYNIISGTFDTNDVICYIASSIAFVFFNNNSKSYTNSI